MYQLTAISGANVYGADFSYDLAPLTLITGLNTAGKTKILNTVRLILNGYLPRLGATNRATFSAAGNLRDAMAVIGSFQDRTSSNANRISRVWTKNPTTGAVSLKEEVPHELKTPEVLCDFSLFLKMKSAERTAYVFERVKIESNIGARVGEDVAKLRDKFPAKYGDPALSSVLEIVDLQFAQCKKFNYTIQETLARTIKSLTDQKKLIAAKVKATNSAMLALRHEGPIPQDIQPEIDALYLEQKKVYDAIVLLKERVSQADKHATSRKVAEACIADTTRALAEYTPKKLKAYKKALAGKGVCEHCGARNSDYYNAKEAQQRYHALQDRLKVLEASLATMPRISDVEAAETLGKLQVDETTLAQRRSVLDQKQALFVQWKAKRVEMDNKTKEGLRFEMESEVFGAAIKTIVAIQEDQLTQTFGQLLKFANQFTVGLLPHELEYRNGEIGWMTPRGWVCNDLFSGYQERLAFSGLQVALCQSAPCKIVMVDEMGTLHPDLKNEFVDRMLSLIDNDVIDQCLLIDVTSKDYDQVWTNPSSGNPGQVGLIHVE